MAKVKTLKFKNVGMGMWEYEDDQFSAYVRSSPWVNRRRPWFVTVVNKTTDEKILDNSARGECGEYRRKICTDMAAQAIAEALVAA